MTTTGTLRIHHDGNGHVGRCPGLTEKPCTRPGTYRLMIMGWLAGEPVCAVCAKEAERAWLDAGGAPALRTARKRRLAR